jgi:hypothetical protein
VATSPWAEFTNAAVDLLPTVVPSGCEVFDGYGVTDEDPEFFMVVGSLTDAGVSVNITQTPGPIGNRARDEIGVLSCIVYCRNGDGDQRAARTAVAEALAAAEQLVRDNYNLGIERVWKAEFQQSDIQQDQHEDIGAWAIAEFSLIYQARI